MNNESHQRFFMTTQLPLSHPAVVVQDHAAGAATFGLIQPV
jgi:hypothetical protein